MGRLKLATSIVACVLAGLAATACSAPAKAASRYDGTVLDSAIAKPALVLTDDTGASFDLRQRTAGKISLLFFGYTNCPDDCPTVMADIAIGLKALPNQERSHISVVFVTSDPHRDSPTVLKIWLNKFDPSFVGLTGASKTIYAAAKTVGVPLTPPVIQPGVNYEVDHGLQVLAFDTNDKARLVYLLGTTSEQYTHDLDLLVQGQGPK